MHIVKVRANKCIYSVRDIMNNKGRIDNNMEKVKLLDGLFKVSQDKGKEYLEYLDVDRLVAPCYEAIGKTSKKPRYGGWESMAISGHSLGHFLSALASMYVAEGGENLK